MKHPAYFMALDALPASSTLADLSARLLSSPRKAVGTVQVAELCSMADYPNGLYLFFHPNGELWYVGKSTSRSFIERVPSHFDQREIAWFNTLPKKIFAIGEAANYADALTLGLSMEVVLLGVKANKIANKLESDLRSHLKPKLNARLAEVRADKRLSEYDI
jgi:excinuclease UvrABC nuclease subunit